ncbi:MULTISPECIES: hypothetical protein [Sphingobacterium]|uniref:hypothetical protein n=1 Tax=Sphingobacterium TaxID=28453 RepID=UPI001AE0E95A|nr:MULTISPECIES: hypothetical protein [unclassified Sphingobacterium]
MKDIKFLTLCVLAVSLSFASCKKEILQDSNNEGKALKGKQVTSQDSLETLYMMQSNLELLLADRIISKSNGFVLDISKQEAVELEIPDDLYQRYQDKVSELNKSIITK